MLGRRVRVPRGRPVGAAGVAVPRPREQHVLSARVGEVVAALGVAAVGVGEDVARRQIGVPHREVDPQGVVVPAVGHGRCVVLAVHRDRREAEGGRGLGEVVVQQRPREQPVADHEVRVEVGGEIGDALHGGGAIGAEGVAIGAEEEVERVGPVVQLLSGVDVEDVVGALRAGHRVHREQQRRGLVPHRVAIGLGRERDRVPVGVDGAIEPEQPGGRSRRRGAVRLDALRVIVEGDVGGGLSRDALDHQPVRLAIDAIAEEGAIVGAAEVARVRSRLGHRAGEPRLRMGDGHERGEQDDHGFVARADINPPSPSRTRSRGTRGSRRPRPNRRGRAACGPSCTGRSARGGA